MEQHALLAIATGAAGGCGVVLLFLAVAGRTQPVKVTVGPMPVMVVTVQEADGTLVITQPQLWLDEVAAQMGEKAPKEQRVPSRPFPGQKTPPCDPNAREEELGGGCWLLVGGTAPCHHPSLYRSGDKCYRPIAAAPEKRSQVPPNTPTLPLSEGR